MADRRRAHRPEHRALYNLPQWSILRRKVLDRDNWTCQWSGCGTHLIGKGNAHNAPVAHHKQDHKGNLDLFLDEGNIIAVCKQCHDQQAQRFTHRGYVSGHDEDGFPIDPDHPWARQRALMMECK